MKTRIAILVPSLAGGGAERVASELSNSLKDLYEVFFIIFDGSNQVYKANGTIINLNLPPKNGIRKFVNFIKRIYVLTQVKKSNRIKVTISFLDSANIPNVLSFGNTIITYHSMHSISGRSFYFKIATKFIMLFSPKIVAVSHGVKHDIEKYYKLNNQEIEVIYNLTQEVSKLYQNNVFGDYLINVGSLRYPKGQWHLIKSFKIIKEKYPSLKLLILGDGELKVKLVQLVQILGLADSVIFTGFVEDPMSYIHHSRAFVYTSLYEGLSNVLIEALKVGSVVISTDCKSGPREILCTDPTIESSILTSVFCDYGVLVPPYNVNFQPDFSCEISYEEKEYANAVIKILNNKVKYDEYKTKSLIRAKEFSIENITQKWIKLIEGIK